MILIGPLLRGLLRLIGRLLLLLLVLSVAAKLATFGLALYAEQHRDQVETLASRLLGTQVRMEKIETSWRGLTPRLWLRRLTVGGKHETLFLGDVLVAVDFSALPWLRHNLPVSLVLTGTRITIERDAKGRTRILGLLEPTGMFNPPSRLLVQDATVEWRDLGRNAHFEEPHLDLLLRSRGNHARLSIQSRHRELLIRGDIQGSLTTPDWSAQFWAEGKNLRAHEPLQPYLPGGYRLSGLTLDFQTWSHWEHGRHVATRLLFQGDGAELQREERPPLAIRKFRGDLLFQTQPGGWNLQLAGLTLQLDGAPPLPPLNAALLASGDRRLLGISAVDLGSLTPLARHLPLTAEQGEAWTQLAPAGRLEQLRLVTGPDRHWLARGRIAGLRTRPWKKLPGLQGFSGEFLAQAQQVELRLHSRDAVIDFRPLFREPLEIRQLSGTLEWRRTSPREWLLESSDLVASNRDLRTRTRLRLTGGTGRPLFMDMQTDFSDGDGRRAGRYYPVGIMKDTLVEWLDRAIVMGKVTSGSFILYGPLASFPFHETHDGHFEVLFQAEALELKYHPEWPPLEEARASVRFHNNSLEIRADHARLYHSRLGEVVARIPSLKPLRHLDVEGVARGPLADQFRLLRETPLRTRLARYVKGLDIHGDGRMRMRLRIPFGSGKYDFRGKLRLRNAILTLQEPGLSISRLNGELEIDNQGIRGRGLHGRALEADIRFDITPRRDATRIEAKGRIPVPGLLRLQPALGLLNPSGATRVNLQLDLPSEPNGKTKLQLRSNLEGLGLDLPPPLGKQPAEQRPLEASLILSPAGNDFSLRMEQALDLTLHPEADGRQALRLSLPRLPLRHWVNWFGKLPANRQADTFHLDQIHIHTNLLEAYPLQARDLTLNLQRGPDSWRGTIASSAISGRFHYDLSTSDHHLSLNLDHLKLTTRPEREKEKRTATDSARVPVDPRNIASLDLRSREFRFNRANLGELTLKTVHSPEGQLIEQLRLSGGIAEIKASGAWIHQDAHSFTRLDGVLNTPDMGRFLRRALLMDFLAGSKAYFSFDLSWPGAPYQFDLTRLQGRLQLDMTAGRFLNIKPGAARILGLLNVQAIGRRLQFGFKDVYEKGLAFDTIMGSFQLDNGLIYTNDLEISAPSSTIRIAGSTNLAGRTHDQVVTVSPRLDATLPVAGAILGGPTTGLVVLLAQQALAGKLEEMQRITYSVTGPWDDPRVKLLQPEEGTATDTADLLNP